MLIPLLTAALLASHRAGPTSTPARAAPAPPLGQVLFIKRGLTVRAPGARPVQGKVHMPIFARYALHTDAGQLASIRFGDGTVLHLNGGTDALLRSPNVTFVSRGEVFEALAPGTDHRVQTSSAIAAAVGTTFLVLLQGGGSYFMVQHGAVLVSNQLGSVLVKNAQGAFVLPGQPPQPAYPVDAGTESGWTRGMPAPNLGENVALDASGGYVAGYSSQRGGSYGQPSPWAADFAIDGHLDSGWESAANRVHDQWIKVGFAGNATYRLSTVIVDPAATQGDPASMDLKDFEIRVSTTGTAEGNFVTVFRGTCTESDRLQAFSLPSSVRAKYVELRALDNYGNPHHLAVAEFEVFGSR
ncbi:MAG: discoidin domain-containing protein [Chloroflexi bacterium]|nr:discoidin domain-containing protein [Chloroflexota bacterium]